MPLAPDEIKSIANALVAARTGPLVPTPARGPASDAEAYAIQNVMTAVLARPVKAWKVGAANPQSTPNGAPIFDVYPASGPVPGQRSTGVELEIAFRLDSAFARSGAAPSRAAVEAAIGAAHIALETCASRLAQGMDAPAHLRLADFGTNLGLVIGPEVAGWRTMDANSLVARVEADSKVIAETRGGHTAPDLVGLLTWIVGHAVTERDGMAAGTWITTGSWMGIRWVATPAVVKGTFEGLGSIEVRLTA